MNCCRPLENICGHWLILMCYWCLYTGSLGSSLWVMWGVHPAFVTRRFCHLCQHNYLQQRQQSQGSPCRCWLPTLSLFLCFSVMTCYMQQIQQSEGNPCRHWLPNLPFFLCFDVLLWLPAANAAISRYSNHASVDTSVCLPPFCLWRNIWSLNFVGTCFGVG